MNTNIFVSVKTFIRTHLKIVSAVSALLVLGALFAIALISMDEPDEAIAPSPSARVLTPEERRQELLNRLSAPENQPNLNDEQKEERRQELLERLSSPENQPNLSDSEKEAKREELLRRLSAPENQQ